MEKSLLAAFGLAAAASFALSGCGGGGAAPSAPGFAIGGTVNGLRSPAVLQNNGGDDLTVSADGSFAFATPLASGASYAISIKTEPSQPAQTCTVTGGSGSVGTAAVTDATVVCVTNTYSISGTVSGPLPTTLILLNNGRDEIQVSPGATSFSFPTPVPSGGQYVVDVKFGKFAAPGYSCSVTPGGGLVGSANVTSPVLSCVALSHSIGGVVSGPIPDGLVLQLNGTEQLAVPAGTATFTFATPVLSTFTYVVGVVAEPLHYSCHVSPISGTVADMDITNLVLTCTHLFAMGGTIAAPLPAGGVEITFAPSGTTLTQIDALSPGATSFQFRDEVVNGTYDLGIKFPPAGYFCSITPPQVTVADADITNLVLSCTSTAPSSHTIGGVVSGPLPADGIALLIETVSPPTHAIDGLAVAGSATSFQFFLPVLGGQTYDLSIISPTPGLACNITPAEVTVGNADITNLVLSCVPTFQCGVSENGTVVTHSANITASETWAGAGTVHVVPNNINIAAPATVTVQSCAIVKVADNVAINVQGGSLVASGDTGVVTFRSTTAPSSAAHRWTGLRGLDGNSRIELDNVLLSDAAPAATAAAIVMTGTSTGSVPDRVLKVSQATLQNLGGPGIHLSNAAFTADSTDLNIGGSPGYPLEVWAMALGSVPAGNYTGNGRDQVRVVENANIFDSLDVINPGVPISFPGSGVHVGGLAPKFVTDLTLTLEAGVTLRFDANAASPSMMVFGDVGQTHDKNAAFVVKGTAAQPVTLSSGAASPAPGDWAGIWLATSNGSQLDHLIIEYAGGDAHIGPASCGPFDPSINQKARHSAALIVGDGTDLQYLPPASLVTNSTFRNNTGNFAIDSVWEASTFGPALNASNSFGGGAKFCTQSKNLKIGGCFVAGVDQSGCLVP